MIEVVGRIAVHADLLHHAARLEVRGYGERDHLCEIELLEPGDAVVRSRAGASLELFAHYAARGVRFRELVRERTGEALDA